MSLRALALLVGVAGVAVPDVRAAGQHDLAVVGVRVPATAKLTKRRPVATKQVVVTIENRGTEPVAFADAAHLAGAVHVVAEPGAGPIVCPVLTLAPRLRPAAFPRTLRPLGRLRVRLDLLLVCARDPEAAADWTFTVTADHAAADGHADENTADDRCPRAALGTIAAANGTVQDRGCGGAGGAGTPLATDVVDRRAATRFALAGPYGVGSTTLALVDSTRPTMANGTYPGAPDRTLPTEVWYPATAGAGGTDVPLAADGRPYPLIVFAHALSAYKEESTFLCEHLASHGYVVVSPDFPLGWAGAPGGSTVADVPAQAGDVRFLIDTMLALAADTGSRFAGGIDAERIGMTGHSMGGLTTLVATYDRDLRDPRIKAALPLSPAACWLTDGYFTDVAVPQLWLHGTHDLLADITTYGLTPFGHANPPKALVVVDEGNHLGFADVGSGIDDAFACSLFPDPGAPVPGAMAIVEALGGASHGVTFAGCTVPSCAGDPSHIDGRRQQQIAKQVGTAFFAAVLRGDPKAARYIARDIGPTNPDVSYTSTPR